MWTELSMDGYDIVSTNNSTQAIALLYIMHSVAAVVLDRWAREQTSFDVRGLKPTGNSLTCSHRPTVL